MAICEQSPGPDNEKWTEPRAEVALSAQRCQSTQDQPGVDSLFFPNLSPLFSSRCSLTRGVDGPRNTEKETEQLGESLDIKIWATSAPLTSKEWDRASGSNRNESRHKLENNAVSLMEKMQISEAAMMFYANVLMKHKKRHISDCGRKKRHLHNVCLQIGVLRYDGFREGQAVLLKVPLKNVLLSEMKGRHSYS